MDSHNNITKIDPIIDIISSTDLIPNVPKPFSKDIFLFNTYRD